MEGRQACHNTLSYTVVFLFFYNTEAAKNMSYTQLTCLFRATVHAEDGQGWGEEGGGGGAGELQPLGGDAFTIFRTADFGTLSIDYTALRKHQQ